MIVTDSQIVQSVTCLSADTCLTADTGVTILIQARSNAFVDLDHAIISTAILLPSAVSRKFFVSYKQKNVQEVRVNVLVKLVQEKSVAR